MVNPLCKERFPSLNLSFQRWNRRGNSLLSSEKHRLTGTNLLLTAINRLYSGTWKKMKICRFCNTFLQWVCRLFQWNALHILLFAVQCNVLLCRTLKLQSRTCLHFCKFPMQYTVLCVGSVCFWLCSAMSVCIFLFVILPGPLHHWTEGPRAHPCRHLCWKCWIGFTIHKAG